jgi:hypothetical protein
VVIGGSAQSPLGRRSTGAHAPPRASAAPSAAAGGPRYARHGRRERPGPHADAAASAAAGPEGASARDATHAGQIGAGAGRGSQEAMALHSAGEETLARPRGPGAPTWSSTLKPWGCVDVRSFVCMYVCL